MKSIQDSYVMANGNKIPCVGFGTWKLTDPGTAADIIKTAIDCGYRHIDTAFAYYNETYVGKAIRTCGLKRTELFVTTKLSNGSHGYENTLKEFEMSMNNLDIDYVDLYLIHWPRPYAIRDTWKEHLEGTWKAFEELYHAGKVKAIGVSNFLEHHLEAPGNRIHSPDGQPDELHPRYVQRDVVRYCKDHRIVPSLEPLMKGEFNYPVLEELSKKYNKSIPQILFAGAYSTASFLFRKHRQGRMLENADIFDFELTEEDIKP